ncbi:UxaA family hydrolase [Sporomusa termitida]|uniref:Galactarate dehydratase (L-threo-forming) n=1 Tax=Sporomusa termitida TaxID=2377 RepID=A0A517E1B4_9FIRM|nr:UxaA family hydrolase [Sporomusa termitida]QDR83395.1 Galactarate dehydratase (L-threo-forming) [Sporomusa termitida]
MAIDAIVLSDTDNVATAVQDLKAGQEASVRLGLTLTQVVLRQDIAYGHKFAVRPIRLGDDILKYGEVIGRATADIPSGCHAHVQNIESLRGRGDLQKED